MFIGAIGVALLLLLPSIGMIQWMKMKGLPNVIGTILGLCIVSGVSVVLVSMHSAHTVLAAVAIMLLGIPGFIALNPIPRKER